jgi:hypothetical protein
MVYFCARCEAMSWNSGAALLPSGGPPMYFGRSIMMPTTNRGASAGKIPANVIQWFSWL